MTAPTLSSERAVEIARKHFPELDSMVKALDLRIIAAIQDAFAAGARAENEACALRAEQFAEMMESGAGEPEPGQRFRQLARTIRARLEALCPSS